ncbi:hypothetical protein G9C98_005628 [Cotesia typhae]|uniref:Sugar transporter SWEET1 n=1 Tax=Cotesia typhae TaxID=2053667 RepID=A0A8J5R393_9HYME|nr:hypothetical protein G9C98_005628 [Cotesia typhae]
MGLEDYKEIVANVASVCTMGHMLSGTGMLMFQYAFILNDPAMIKVNMFGLTTSILYVTVFYLYAPNKGEMMKLIGKTLGLASIFLAYAKFESPDLIEFRYGLLTTALLLMLVGTPLMNLDQVIKTKSTEILPFPLIAMGTVVSFLWLLYGIIIDNGFIVFQNIVGLLLYFIQLSLFAIYPSKPAEATSSHSKKE